MYVGTVCLGILVPVIVFGTIPHRSGLAAAILGLEAFSRAKICHNFLINENLVLIPS
jgi:hypothetical protein